MRLIDFHRARMTDRGHASFYLTTAASRTTPGEVARLSPSKVHSRSGVARMTDGSLFSMDAFQD